jgi:hypothetical protein
VSALVKRFTRRSSRPNARCSGGGLPGVNFADAIVRYPGIADDLISALEVRAIWGRYGL